MFLYIDCKSFINKLLKFVYFLYCLYKIYSIIFNTIEVRVFK